MTTNTARGRATGRPVLWDLGFCRTCRLYRVYDGPCPVCGDLLQDRWEIDKEIELELAQLLMATQHLHKEEPEVNRLINPMWRINAPMGVDGPARPKTEFSPGMPAKSAGPDTIRGAIRILRGIAATYGVLPLSLDLRPQEGREIVIHIDSEPWLAFQNSKGTITPIRRQDIPTGNRSNAGEPPTESEPSYKPAQKRARKSA